LNGHGAGDRAGHGREAELKFSEANSRRGFRERARAAQNPRFTSENTKPERRGRGLSPSSTPDDTGNYGGYGVEGLTLPAGRRLAQCKTCATETTVAPHASAIALPVLPEEAYANVEMSIS
jgi:hypothetical protein